MAEIVPFHGLRYDEKVAGDVARLLSPPFDVISPKQQDELYAKSTYNVVRVELGKNEPGDNPVENRYERAKRTLDEWLERGALRVDYEPAFYLLDHYFAVGDRRLRRRGFFCALRLYDWGRGVVRPHERIFPENVQDRLRLLRLTRVNTSAVFLLYDDEERRVARFLEEAMAHGPARLVADTRSGEERFLLMALDDRFARQKLAEALAEKRLYIADGHHRYETALQYMREEQKRGRIEVDEDTPTFVFAYLVATQDPGLVILPTHRVVRGAPDAVRDAAARAFDAAPIDAGALEDQQPPIALARDGRIDALRLRPGIDLGGLPESWRSLPVAQAEELLLKPARAAGAEVTYTHETSVALEAAREGAASVLVRAVEPETLMRVADARERLPQKTTYFYPKVPTGLVMRSLGE